MLGYKIRTIIGTYNSSYEITNYQQSNTLRNNYMYVSFKAERESQYKIVNAFNLLYTYNTIIGVEAHSEIMYLLLLLYDRCQFCLSQNIKITIYVNLDALVFEYSW